MERQSAAASALLAEHVCQRFAFDELQHKRLAAGKFLDTVDSADVRVIERGEHPGFALEAREAIGLGAECQRDNLDRHVPLEFVVPGAVDLAHPTLTNRSRPPHRTR